jgi:hypothetical protein
VVIHIEGDVPKPAPARKLSDRQKIALDALAECSAEPAPASLELPAGTMVVKIADWRAELVSRGAIDPEASNPREDFKRIRTSLQARALIGERDGSIWSTRHV